MIEAVIQSTLSFTAVPSDTDTTLTLDAKVSRGLSEYVVGATDTSDWSVLVNGVANPVTLVAEVSNVYTLTVTAVATDDVIVVSFNGVIDITGDGLYRSFSVSETVVS